MNIGRNPTVQECSFTVVYYYSKKLNKIGFGFILFIV